jgi:hypothetical protein
MSNLLEQASICITPNGQKAGKLYSIKPTDGSGDLVVTRATSATRVDANGLVEIPRTNLLLQSQTFDNASWGKTNLTVTSNAVTAPDGTTTADKIIANTTNGTHIVNQFIAVGISTSHTVSLYAKKGEYSALRINFISSGNTFISVNLDTGVIVSFGGTIYLSSSIENVGDGWYRVTMTFLPPVATNSLNFFIENPVGTPTFAGDNTSGIYIWGAQLQLGNVVTEYIPTVASIRTKFAGITQDGSSASNIPRLDYTNGTCPSILVEPQRTNLFLNSVFNGTGSTPTSWSVGFATGTSAPAVSTKSTGVQAYTFTTSASRQTIVQLLNYVSGTTYACSVYVENVTGTISASEVLYFNGIGTQTFYKDGVLISSSTPIVSGSRYTAIFLASATLSQQVIIGNGCTTTTTGSVRLSMPQLETGSNATSYIPTVAASVTRNADGLSKANVYTNGWVSSTGGTFFVDLKNNVAQIRASASPYPVLFLSSNTSGTGSTSIGFGAKNTTPSRLFVYYIKNGTFVESVTTTTDNAKIAIVWTPTTMKIFQNGVLLTSITGIVWDITTLQNLGEISQVVLNINSMALFPTPLTDAECIQLTTL